MHERTHIDEGRVPLVNVRIRACHFWKWESDEPRIADARRFYTSQSMSKTHSIRLHIKQATTAIRRDICEISWLRFLGSLVYSFSQ
jgi:hypothetical protein